LAYICTNGDILLLGYFSALKDFMYKMRIFYFSGYFSALKDSIYSHGTFPDIQCPGGFDALKNAIYAHKDIWYFSGYFSALQHSIYSYRDIVFSRIFQCSERLNIFI